MLSFLKRRIFFLVMLCCFLALVPFPELENRIFDLKLVLRGPLDVPEDVLLLEFTRDDFEELKQITKQTKLPGSGIYHSWLDRYEKLQDLFFWNNVVYERILERVLKENPKFFLMTQLYPDSAIHLKENPRLQNHVRNPKIIWASQFDADQNFIKPAPELSAAENYGFINVAQDSDQIVRRAFLIYHNHASLPFRALLTQSTFPREVSLTDPFLINFRGPRNTVPSCRVLSLFRPMENPCPDLEDKYVLLWITNSGSTEGIANFQTPLGNMSRAEILANILITVKEKQFFHVVPIFVFFVFLVAHVYIFAFVVLQFN